MCHFCGHSSNDAAAQEEHILSHFCRKHCYECDNALISIAGQWYQLHIDVNCNATKCEPDCDAEEIEIHSDPLAIAENAVKREQIGRPVSTANAPEAPLPVMISVASQTDEDALEAANKPHTCPFCPARFSFASNCSRHKHQYHKQEIEELRSQKNAEKQRGKRKQGNSTAHEHVEAFDVLNDGGKGWNTGNPKNAAEPNEPVSKPYACSFCPATFVHTANRSRHNFVYHPNELTAMESHEMPASDQKHSPTYDNEAADSSENYEFTAVGVENTFTDFIPATGNTAATANIENDLVEEKFSLESNAFAEDLLGSSRSSCSESMTKKSSDHDNQADDNCSKLLIRSHACPFCPARFTFASNRSRHKHQYHKQEIAELRAYERRGRSSSMPWKSDGSSGARIDEHIQMSENADHDELMEMSIDLEDTQDAAAIAIDPLEEIALPAPDAMPDALEALCALDDDAKNTMGQHGNQSDVGANQSSDLMCKPHACPFCTARFTFARDRSRHKLACHRPEIAMLRALQIKETKKMQPSPDASRAGRASNVKSFDCKFCSAVYNYRGSLNIHMHRRHKKEMNKLKLLKPTRANNFDLVSGASDTVETIETVACAASCPKPYKCKFCPAEYKYHASHYQHMLRNHKNEMNELKLSKIIGDNDSNVASKKCDENAESEVEEIIAKYETSNSKSETKYTVEMWSCGMCTKSFNWKQNAHKHLRVIHGSNDDSVLTPVTHEYTANLWFCSLCYVTSRHRFSLYTHAWLLHRTKDRRLVKPIQDWRDPDQLQLGAGEKVTCNYCSMTFTDKAELNEHKRAEHAKELDDPGVVKCGRCPAIFSGNNLHQIHSIQVHGVLDQLYLNKLDCLVCGESFKSCNTLVTHLKAHDPLNTYVCATKSCDDQFDTIEQLHAHLRSHPFRGENRQKCKKCGKRCRELAFADHHCTENLYCCHHCGKQFSKLFLFKVYLDRHAGNKRYKCEYCPQTFVSLNTRLRHHRTHTGEKRCKCTVPNCGKAFGQHVDLYRHQFRAHGIFRKKFPCTICDEVFPENSLLRKHLACHDS